MLASAQIMRGASFRRFFHCRLFGCSGEQRPANGAMRGSEPHVFKPLVVPLFHVERLQFVQETSK